jgi:hypothetical protein
VSIYVARRAADHNWELVRVETSRLDIWILDGFSLGGRRLARLGF